MSISKISYYDSIRNAGNQKFKQNLRSKESEPANTVNPKYDMNFKGNVGPIEKICMQPLSVVSTYFRKFGHIDISYYQAKLFKQLQKVGAKEGFEVVYQGNNKRVYSKAPRIKKLLKNLSGKVNKEVPERVKMSCWAQDNGIYVVDRSGRPMIAEHGLIRETEEGLLKSRAKQMGIGFKKMFSRADGGNTYFGVTKGGERYILVGSNAIEDTALKIALEKQGIELKNLLEASNGTVRIDYRWHKYYTSIPDIENGTMDKSLPEGLKRSAQRAVEDMHENIAALRVEARKALAADFDMDVDQLKVVSSPGFHIDMFMRPIDEKTILVNDPQLTVSLLERRQTLTKSPRQKRSYQKLIDELNAFEENRKANGYASMDVIYKELKDLGYENIIHVPGIHGPGNTNYMNALVHQRPNGEYIYITNAGAKNAAGLNLNEIFKSSVQKQFPEMKEFYFLGDIEGTPISDRIGLSGKWMKFINDLLLREDGGTHCSSFEMCKFPTITK